MNTYDEASRIKEVTCPTARRLRRIRAFRLRASSVIDHRSSGKKGKGISDALGRMVRVIEDPTSQNLSTDYAFDTLGNLRKTIQGDRNRYFNTTVWGDCFMPSNPNKTRTAYSVTPIRYG